ncbi:MAG: protein kinase [Pirellula sp.]|jgi:serine/threonine protein kinase/tetratricopeptide (TPR) repeat protein|nr:protein kinase [Pirellula sp.]
MDQLPKGNPSEVEPSEALLEQWLNAQNRAWASGKPIPIEEIVGDRLTDVREDDAEWLLSLICNEVGLREEQGDRPTLEEYQRRFPNIDQPLILQWEINRLMETGDIQGAATLQGIAPREDGKLPSRVGRYEVLRVLGRGAMGIVFEVWDPKLKRTVALKRLRAGGDADVGELHRMRTEAEAVGRLIHPNLVQIFDIGEDGGQPFLVMEYCPEGTLAEHLSNQLLPPKEAAQVTKQIADAVAAAHQLGIVHRDLKPANLLLVSSNPLIIKVSDFGLAKHLGTDNGITVSGSLIGSPAYMSPEQAVGKTSSIAPASDVYSIGAILYECLTGRPPFRGASIVETLDQVRHMEPLRVRQLQPRVPLDLETITHKCLSKETERRYATASELSEDLQRFLEQRPILARRERWYQATWRVIKKYPTISALSSITILLLATIAIVTGLFAKQLSNALTNVQRSERTARLEKAEALLGKAKGIRIENKPGRRFETLKTIREAVKIGKDLAMPDAWFAPYRDEAIAAMWLSDLHVMDWQELPAAVQAGDTSVDGRRYAICAITGDVELRDAQDHSLIAKIPRLHPKVVLAFAGNDKLLQLSLVDGQHECWDITPPKPKRLWKQEQGFFSFSLRDDASLLAMCSASEIWFVDVATGEKKYAYPNALFSREPQLAIHPNKPLYLIHSNFQPFVELRHLETNESLWHFQPPEEARGISGAHWFSDGLRFELINGNASLLVEGRMDKDLTRVEAASTKIPVWIADADLVTTSDKSETRRLFLGWSNCVQMGDTITGSPLIKANPLNRLSGTRNLRLTQSDSCLGLAWSAAAVRKYGTLDVALGLEEQVVFPSESRLSENQFAVDPTGRLLVVISDSNDVHWIDLNSKREIGVLPFVGLSPWRVVFDHSNHIYLIGANGSLQFAYEIDQDTVSLVEVPTRVLGLTGKEEIAMDANGKTMATGNWSGYGMQDYAGIRIKFRQEPMFQRVTGVNSAKFVAVSLDGETILGQQGDEILVFNRAGDIVQRFPTASFPPAGFSDDGKLAVAAGKLWQTDSWNPVAIGRSGEQLDFVAMSISRDGKQIGGIMGDDGKALVNTATGQVFAKFEGSLSRFIGDGNRILHSDRRGLVLRDLQTIRTQLAELGFPWEGPDYEPRQEKVPLRRLHIGPLLRNVHTCEELLSLVDEVALERSRQHPHDGDSAFAAAMIHIERRQMGHALEKLNQAVQALPISITPRQWRAYVLAELKRWPEAVNDADWILEQIDAPEFRLRRAEWLINTGRPELAIADCQKVLEQQVGFVRLPHSLMAIAYRDLGDDEKSKQELDHARVGLSDLNLINSMIFRYIGPDISLRHPRIAQLHLDLLPTDDESLHPYYVDTIAWALLRNEEFEAALRVNRPNLERKDSLVFPMAHCVAAICNARLGSLEEAEQHLATAEQVDRKDLETKADFNVREYQLLLAEAREALSACRSDRIPE